MRHADEDSDEAGRLQPCYVRFDRGPGLMDPNCEFCSIVSGSEKALVVKEWPESLAIFPLQPATFGHTLIIPRRHIIDIWGVDLELGRSLSDRVFEVARAVKNAYTPDGLNIVNSSGEAATQSVFHFHIHVVPRYAGDGMGQIWPQGGVTEAEKKRAFNQIRKSVSRSKDNC